MVHSVETLCLLVPLKHWEVNNPQRSELERIAQAELLTNLKTQCAELCEHLELLATHNKAEVALLCTKTLGNSAQRVCIEELVDR